MNSNRNNKEITKLKYFKGLMIGEKDGSLSVIRYNAG